MYELTGKKGGRKGGRKYLQTLEYSSSRITLPQQYYSYAMIMSKELEKSQKQNGEKDALAITNKNISNMQTKEE